METRKSIRDIKSSNPDVISDIVAPKPIRKKVAKPVEAAIEPEPFMMSSEDMEMDEPVEDVIEDPMTSPAPTPNPRQAAAAETRMPKQKQSLFRRIRNIIVHINRLYLIGFVLILAGLGVLLFVKPTPKDPVEQAKQEAEMVKKDLSKHIILPTDEQIDIRKITNKLDDPFFKDAQIGDYLIILYKNRIAYIYSVDKDIIVNAGVVFIDPKTATSTDATTTKTSN